MAGVADPPGVAVLGGEAALGLDAAPVLTRAGARAVGVVVAAPGHHADPGPRITDLLPRAGVVVVASIGAGPVVAGAPRVAIGRADARIPLGTEPLHASPRPGTVGVVPAGIDALALVAEAYPDAVQITLAVVRLQANTGHLVAGLVAGTRLIAARRLDLALTLAVVTALPFASLAISGPLTFPLSPAVVTTLPLSFHPALSLSLTSGFALSLSRHHAQVLLVAREAVVARAVAVAGAVEHPDGRRLTQAVLADQRPIAGAVAVTSPADLAVEGARLNAAFTLALAAPLSAVGRPAVATCTRLVSGAPTDERPVGAVGDADADVLALALQGAGLADRRRCLAFSRIGLATNGERRDSEDDEDRDGKTLVHEQLPLCSAESTRISPGRSPQSGRSPRIPSRRAGRPADRSWRGCTARRSRSGCSRRPAAHRPPAGPR